MKSMIVCCVAISSLAMLACSASSVRTERSPGEKLFRANCRSCHILPEPQRHTDEEWPHLVNRYSEFTKLDEYQRAEMIKYLQSAN